MYETWPLGIVMVGDLFYVFFYCDIFFKLILL